MYPVRGLKLGHISFLIQMLAVPTPCQMHRLLRFDLIYVRRSVAVIEYDKVVRAVFLEFGSCQRVFFRDDGFKGIRVVSARAKIGIGIF